MPGISADGAGNVTGEIDVQDNDLTSDIHEIEIFGDQGSVVKGVYINDPSLDTSDLRKAVATGGADLIAPIAQTFSFGASRDIAAIDLDIDASDPGDGDVIVQIRETTNGLPNQKVLSESRVAKIDIQASGTFTRFNLSPIVPIIASREYALVVITKNVEYTIAIAELGSPDSLSGNIIAGQPNAGVFLTSSNGTVWTAEHNKDLKFKILAAKYTANTKTVDLGNISANDITDILVLAHTELTDKDTRVRFQITDPDSTIRTIQKDQPIVLDAKKSGTFNVQAILEGNENKSPILFPNTKLIVGEIQLTGDYQSRKFSVPNSFTMRLIIETRTTGSATHQPQVENTSAGNFTNIPLINAVTLEDGFVQETYELAGLTAIPGDLTSIKLGLTATDTGRVFLRDLRAFPI